MLKWKVLFIFTIEKKLNGKFFQEAYINIEWKNTYDFSVERLDKQHRNLYQSLKTLSCKLQIMQSAV